MMARIVALRSLTELKVRGGWLAGQVGAGDLLKEGKELPRSAGRGDIALLGRSAP